MQKKIFINALIIVVTMGTACKKNYSDLRESLIEVIKIGDVFATSIDSADSSKKVIDAIELYKKDLNAATPKFKSSMKKYKDINFRNPKTIPSVIEDVYKQYMDTQERIVIAINTIMTKYSSDKTVKDSLKSIWSKKGMKSRSHKSGSDDDKE